MHQIGIGLGWGNAQFLELLGQVADALLRNPGGDVLIAHPVLVDVLGVRDQRQVEGLQEVALENGRQRRIDDLEYVEGRLAATRRDQFRQIGGRVAFDELDLGTHRLQLGRNHLALYPLP